MLLSVYLITLNESTHLAEVLERLQGVDEIVVVDSGSTDGTQDIARRYGARVVHQDWLGFAKQKAYAMSLCQGEWVLSMDGDEVLRRHHCPHPPVDCQHAVQRLQHSAARGLHESPHDAQPGRPDDAPVPQRQGRMGSGAPGA